MSAPHDRQAKADRKFAGQTINFWGEGPGQAHRLDLLAAKRFRHDTGINVIVHVQPTYSLAEYESRLRSKSSLVDAGMIDLIDAGALAPYLANLRPQLKSNARQDYPATVESTTIKGRLVSIPWVVDFGLLYYRKDLLKKYGFKSPPTTWSALAHMATKIQIGERAHNKKFYGFVFQGAPYEGLTCDALEWISSFGGGTFVHAKKATIYNPRAIEALNMVKSWVGKISPRTVGTYDEPLTQQTFDAGDAAFARQWPYMYADSMGNASSVRGRFAITALPRGPHGRSTATVAGWALSVAKTSRHIGAAKAFVRYYSSPYMEAWRARFGFLPSMPSVARQKKLLAIDPFLHVKTELVARPSQGLGANYERASTEIYETIHSILLGADTASELKHLQGRLQRLLGG